MREPVSISIFARNPDNGLARWEFDPAAGDHAEGIRQVTEAFNPPPPVLALIQEAPNAAK